MAKISGPATDLARLRKSEEYRDAESRMRSWKQQVERAGKSELLRIRDEKDLFLVSMKASDLALYSAFEIEGKMLGERIFERLTGVKVMMD